MSDKPKKRVKLNIKREAAVLRDEVAFLKKRLDLLFTTCDEGLARLYAGEKDPVVLFRKSLELVRRVKASARTIIEAFQSKLDS